MSDLQERIKNNFKTTNENIEEEIKSFSESILNNGLKCGQVLSCHEFEHPLYNKYIKETGKDFSNRYGYTGEFTEWLMDLIIKSEVIDVWN
jgi:hypothetical protein